MRTLKYRAYIRPLKRYAEKYETILYHHQCNMEPTWTVNISPEEYYGDEELVIEQFTGLSDRNGKEIYEGDIVEFGLSGRAERGYVAYADEYASFEVYSKRDFIFGCLFGHAGKVIGNIHENPELLGETK